MPTEGFAIDGTSLKFSFEDVPLLVPTPEVEAFIEKYLPLRELFGPTCQPATNWLALPQEQWPIVPKINTLYFPTGCTRWGFGAFLFSGEHLDDALSAIQPTGGSRGGSGLLKMGDESDSDHYIEARMYGLRPIPVSGIVNGQNGDYGLYILPLVCPRYIYQNNGPPAGALLSDTGGTLGRSIDAGQFLEFWSGKYGSLTVPEFGDGLGFVDEATIALTAPRQAHTGPQIAEAVSWSQAMTFVPELDASSARYFGEDDAASQWSNFVAQINNGTFNVTAGYASGMANRDANDAFANCGLPTSVTFWYTTSTTGGVNRTSDLSQTLVVNTSDFGVTGVSGSTWAVFTPFVFLTNEDDQANNNGPTLDDFLEAIQNACDSITSYWCAIATKYADVTLAGICAVPLSPHTDLVEWSMGSNGPMTRVRSRAPNAFPVRIVTQWNPGNDVEFAGNFEIVEAIGGSESQAAEGETGVKFDGTNYDAVFPIIQAGQANFNYAPTDDQNADAETPASDPHVIASWDEKTQKFYVLNGRPLDFDYIYEQTLSRLIFNGWVADP
jgi:hypothetical protein